MADAGGSSRAGKRGEREEEGKREHVSMPKRGRKKCEHNTRRNESKDCGGAGICQHSREERLQGLRGHLLSARITAAADAHAQNT